MKLIIKTRRDGKTYDLIEHASKTGAYIVVMNRDEAQRVSKEAEKMKKEIRHPITFDELMKDKMKASFVRNVVIDNADSFLNYILRDIRIEAVTLNGPEPENR